MTTSHGPDIAVRQPFLDSVAGTEAITAAPWTFSSVPSILTGSYPHHHGAVYPTDESRNQDLSNPPHNIDEDVYTLGEILGSAGYQTRFATAIGTAAIPVKGRFGAIVNSHDASAASLLAETAEWWNSTRGEKFAYVQLGDLHEPLHQPDATPFGEIPDIEGVDRWRFEDSTTPREEFTEYREARIQLYDSPGS